MAGLLWGLLALLVPVCTGAAQLRIDLGHGAVNHTSAELLVCKDTVDVRIPDDVAFRRVMRYRAVPLLALLPGLRADEHLQFVTRDGFVAEIPAAALTDPVSTITPPH